VLQIKKKCSTFYIKIHACIYNFFIFSYTIIVIMKANGTLIVLQQSMPNTCLHLASPHVILLQFRSSCFMEQYLINCPKSHFSCDNRISLPFYLDKYLPQPHLFFLCNFRSKNGNTEYTIKFHCYAKHKSYRRDTYIYSRLSFVNCICCIYNYIGK